MDEKTVNKYSEIVWEIIVNAFKHSNEHSVKIAFNKSLMDFFLEKLKEKDISESEQVILLQMAQMWGAFVGDSIEKQSLKFFWLEECIEGENLFVASTYKAILDCVAKTVLAQAEIQFSTTVTSIECFTTLTKETNPRIVLRTNSGSIQTFDEVVITAPLGWLKQNKSAFTPPLSSQISQAINNISYGQLEKVYITFPTTFWDSAPSTLSPTNNDPYSTPHYPTFTHFLKPTYAPHTNPSHWNQELLNLASLPTHTAHPTLLFYIYGSCAQHIASLISHHTPDSSAYLHILADFFYPYYSRLPNFSPQNTDCHPIKALATQWAADPLAGWGSYCNFQISSPSTSLGEVVELDKDIEVLRVGMPERGIWLAGEHTAPFVAVGTVTGAWWSGEGVARRIMAAYEYDADQVKEQEQD